MFSALTSIEKLSAPNLDILFGNANPKSVKYAARGSVGRYM